MSAQIISIRTRRPLCAEPDEGSPVRGIMWVLAFWAVVGLIVVGVWG